VAVKVRIVERPNPCKPNDIVLCYKICNFGPGVASRIFLKSFICPAPAKVCLKENKKLTHVIYKNGIFKACIDCLKPCDCFEFEVILQECPMPKEKCEKKFFDCNFGFEHKKPPRRYEVTTVVEAKEEDLNICNNVDFTKSHEC
jgi:hypothetical protein